MPINISSGRGFVSTPEESPGFWQLGNLWRIMASGPKTNNAFCLIDQLVTPAGGGPCSHAHPMDEGLYVVSGHCTFNAGGQTLSAGPGEFVAIPRFAEHSFTVDSPGTQLLNFYLPAGFELFIMGFAHPAERNELPPLGIPLPPRRLVEQLSRDYGQIPVLGLPGVDRQNADNMMTKPSPGAVAVPFKANSDTAPAYWAAKGLWAILADGSATESSYSLFEVLMPKGIAGPLHIYPDKDEVFYVLAGEAEFLMGDKTQVAKKGDLVFIPRGTPHAYKVNTLTARFLNLHTPSGFERILTSLGTATSSRELPGPDWTQPSLSATQRERLFADLGLRIIDAVPIFAT